MNKAKLLQSILELHKAVEDGNMEKMYRCAYELNALFEREVLEPLEGYDAALMRFKMAEAMVAFYMAVGKQSQAGTLRNRITAHYQAVRKSKEYSVSQKHELKEILRRIKVIVPSQRNVAMLPLEGLEYLKPFNVSSLLSTLPLDMPKSQVVEEMTKYCYDKGGSLAPRSLQRQYKVGGKQAKHLYVIGNGLDMQLPRVDEDDEDFSYTQYFAPLDEITDAVTSCTVEMKYHFHRWINTLHYARGFRKRMLDIDKDAIFLNFNYTLFLESEYGISPEQICYIHGCRKDKFGSLVLGHHSDDQEAFERWKHKNQNRRRYRHVQKDKKGRYFRNDKLAYLAFFHKNDWTGNWRLPIRYYAVEEAEERLEKYYDSNFKNTRKIIDGHMGFFDSLGNVEKITIIGCSLGAVDMDYYKQLKSSVKDDVLWEFSYHSPEDEKRIDKFCKELDIETGCVSTFKM